VGEGGGERGEGGGGGGCMTLVSEYSVNVLAALCLVYPGAGEPDGAPLRDGGSLELTDTVFSGYTKSEVRRE